MLKLFLFKVRLSLPRNRFKLPAHCLAQACGDGYVLGGRGWAVGKRAHTPLLGMGVPCLFLFNVCVVVMLEWIARGWGGRIGTGNWKLGKEVILQSEHSGEGVSSRQEWALF